MMYRIAILAFWLILVHQPCLLADNWPSWRGPSYDGISKEEQVPISWNHSENILWRVAIPGSGHSSPIVWDDAIFLTTCDLAKHSRQLMRLERDTGRIMWVRDVAVSPLEQMHHDNSPASATPATDGKAIFVVFAVDHSLLVSAIDFNGNAVWSRTVGSFAASHGFCTSLVLQADSLFLSGLQDGPDAFVACLNKNTGEIVWKVQRSKAVRSYSTPCLCKVRGIQAVLLSGAEQTIAYDQATGQTIWEIEGPASKTVSSLVVNANDDLAYVCGGRDKQFFAIDLQNVNQSSVNSPQIAWSTRKGIPYMTSPLLARGRLHVLSDDGIYSCFNPKTGDLLYQRRAVGAVKASMVATAKHIYITELSGRTTVIDDSSQWKIVSENEVGEPIVASPAISNGDLILRSEHHLFLIRDVK